MAFCVLALTTTFNEKISAPPFHSVHSIAPLVLMSGILLIPSTHKAVSRSTHHLFKHSPKAHAP